MKYNPCILKKIMFWIWRMTEFLFPYYRFMIAENIRLTGVD